MLAALGADQVFAWPSAEIAVMGPEGAANIIFKKEIEEAADPAAARKDKIEEYKRSFANPYKAAVRGYVDDVIDPADTRARLIAALAMLAGKRETRPAAQARQLPGVGERMEDIGIYEWTVVLLGMGTVFVALIGSVLDTERFLPGCANQGKEGNRSR